MWDVSGTVIGTVMVIRDVTEPHRLARELSYQATHDSLTGLVDRDEFGVLLAGCDVDKANGIAQNLLKTIAEFRFVWNNHTFNVGLSIGIVAGDKNSESVTDLLTAADVACYSAKDAGRNRVHLFRPDDAHTQQRYNEVQWVSRIVRGLDENRFRL